MSKKDKLNTNTLHTENSKHSARNMNDTQTSNQENLKFSLSEFCSGSQEKLLTLKNEIKLLEKEQEGLKKEINQYTLDQGTLQNLDKDLGLRLKGMREMIHNEQKRKNQIQGSIKDLTKQKENLTKEIESMKNDNSYKVKIMENDIEHIHVVKENNMNITRKKIETELANQNKLIERIEEAKVGIDNYNRMINELHHNADKDDEVLKQSAEMTKFLSLI